MIEYLNQLDTNLFLFLNGFNNVFFDNVMVFASARFGWIPFYMLLLYLTIRRYKAKTWLIIVFVILLIFLSDMVSVHAFKNVFERLRPCHNDDIKPLVYTVSYCGGLYGFVSSHATNSFAIAIFLSSILAHYKWIPWVMYAWAVLIIYSRIYLGVHYPGDVIGGAIVGTLIGLLVLYLYRLTAARIYAKNSGEML